MSSNREDEKPRTGYQYDPTVDPTPGGVVKVKNRRGQMVEVPADVRSLSEVVATDVPAPTGSATRAAAGRLPAGGGQSGAANAEEQKQ